ncbi:MAG: hypothetical protein ACHQSE_03640 [Gemmatimonadales bacterium]
MRIFVLAAAAAAFAPCSAIHAQEAPPARTPISIGDYPSVNGLRLNFRDGRVGRVNGVNITLWSPYEDAAETIKGVALGLPVTGGAEIDGIATGLLGVGASGRIRGVTLAPIGAGAGSDISGIAIGGVGLGTGGRLTGLVIGGVGAGAGGDMKGIIIGGVGTGGGGNATGLLAGGVGAGVGGDIHGIVVGGVGAGVGGSIHGIAIGGVGTGAGGDLIGLALAGVGIGAGGSIRGVAIAGIGAGAPEISGGFAALAVGARDARGVILAPALFRIERGGSFRGGSVSAVNYIRGSQTGVTIGLVNYTRSLDGIQIGVLNIVGDAKSHQVMPVVNWGSGKN